ncbi:MAG TPA: acyl-ACP--UDP-N-acetylglucosamine O-acyltransferase [Silvibacterium sp.]|nr:acyl-ACP--UDP-N-acetylglucosamine O-acyltransferase [Silvibacterium sp.]
MSIHSTAIVASSAVVPESCCVGPYSTIGENVVLGEECELVSHVVLDGHLTVGVRNRFFSFACVGVAPQDLKYKGEPTGAALGDDNIVRECVTISRGTTGGGGTTRVGSGCLFMAYAHVGHDTVIGDGCIIANGAAIAGHVIIEDYATVGALNQVHQYCRIGKYAYTGGGTTVTQDVLPFSLTSAKRETHAYGLNKIGLERRGFDEERLQALQRAYRLLLASKLNTAQALEKLKDEGIATDDVAYLVEFIESSERGVLK